MLPALLRPLTCPALCCACLLIAGCGDEGGFSNQQDPDTGKPLAVDVHWMALSGGTLHMGNDAGEDDAPEVTVTLSSFSISLHEVSNASYVHFLNAALAENWVRMHPHTRSDACGEHSEQAVSGDVLAPRHDQEILLVLARNGGCSDDGQPAHPDNRSWIGYDDFTQRFVVLDPGKADWPVNWVSWSGADLYARFYGLILPSEAQWEFAARAGQQLVYPTSNGQLSPAQAHYQYTGSATHPLAGASFPANPYGLYDLGGNLWEWTQDYYGADFYQDGRYDPVNLRPGAEGHRVIRGGAWNSPPDDLASASRSRQHPRSHENHTGFRVARP